MAKPTKTLEQFIDQAKAIFGERYDYSKVVYVNNHTKVTIICPIHGEFQKRPADMTVKRSGCAKCTGTQFCGAYHKKDSAWFAQEGARVHNNQYDYSQVNYVRYHEKVDIICPDHGLFRQTAGSHISNGSGCPTCSVKDYEGGYGHTRFKSHPEIKERDATLYVIECQSEDEQFIKIGITQKTVHERFNVNNRIPYSYNVLMEVSGTLYNLFLLEQHLKKTYKPLKHTPQLSFNGKTECFQSEVLTELLSSISNPPIFQR